MTSRNRLRMLMQLRISLWGILCQIWRRASANCPKFARFGYCCRKRRPRMSQTCSIGFRSGLTAGWPRTDIRFCVVRRRSDRACANSWRALDGANASYWSTVFVIPKSLGIIFFLNFWNLLFLLKWRWTNKKKTCNKCSKAARTKERVLQRNIT